MASLSTHVWVFAVGRGSAAFVRTGLGQGFILDMGGGSSDFIDPVAFIRKHLLPTLEPYKEKKIAQAVLSHPHADHISQCAALAEGADLNPALLTCPHDKDSAPIEERINWGRLNEADKSKQPMIEQYKALYSKRNLPLQTIAYASHRSIPHLEYGLYYILPSTAQELHPTNDNMYGNTLSIMFYLRHGDHTILFPGDMTPEGMKHILDGGAGVQKRYSILNSTGAAQYPDWHKATSSQYTLKSLLQARGLTILVAPHHGLESCYSEELFRAMKGGKPKLNVISERRKAHDGDGNTHGCYQSATGGSGLSVDVDGVVQPRISLTTKGGHHLLFSFAGNGNPAVYARTDPTKLLPYAT